MNPIRIAFYGKGGIGKSTIASNISALFAQSGRRVLHIGCDPKADSTRSLAGKTFPSVLEQLAEKEELSREDILHEGAYGVQCAESGGPEAGCGCAGLGILTAMDELQRLGILEESWDVITYDVLGDVVCGGFSAPMRQHFADRVFVVTSADFMALYAANNILKGINRYSPEGSTLFGGLILNHVKSEADLRIGQAFARRTGTEIISAIAESPSMRQAEYRRKLLIQACPLDDNAERLSLLINRIEELSGHPLSCPSPMNRSEMEAFGGEFII